MRNTPLTTELRNVSKVYRDNCWANRDVNLRVRPGTIHGLIGENGAGKSTAMKILFGMEQPTSGQVFHNGELCKDWSPKKAFAKGVGMVHQHFMLAQSESVLDNLVLGVEESRLGFRNRRKDRERLKQLMDETGLHVQLDARVCDLPVSHQSRCEILKVLYRNASFLILDEPTAVLTPPEVEAFLETLKRLRSHGKTVLIVTHKLKEIMAVADEVTVMRQGQSVAESTVADTSIEGLTELMIGRKLRLPKAPPLASRDAKPLIVMKEFGLEVYPGEVVGIAGIEGNGQEKILNHVLARPDMLRHQPVAIMPPDRHRDALVLSMTLSENLALGRMQAAQPGLSLIRDTSAESAAFLKTHDVRPPIPEVIASSLSGGNQQKLVVARELSGYGHRPNVIVAVHPTRGVDLGAIEQIHTNILNSVSSGAACLLISSELEELMNLSHRIGVVYQGRLAQWFKPDYSEQNIGMAMLTGEGAKS